jgi:hypothetical protein
MRLERLPDSAIPDNPADFWTTLAHKADRGAVVDRTRTPDDLHGGGTLVGDCKVLSA